MQGGKQEVQGDQLLGGAVVLILFVQGWLVLAMSALIAYADTVRVVAGNVAAFDAEGATVVERAVTGHVEVIAGVGAEASFGMIFL